MNLKHIILIGLLLSTSIRKGISSFLRKCWEHLSGFGREHFMIQSVFIVQKPFAEHYSWRWASAVNKTYSTTTTTRRELCQHGGYLDTRVTWERHSLVHARVFSFSHHYWMSPPGQELGPLHSRSPRA